MITDTNLVFSNQQPVTTSTASTNVIDLGTTGTPFGATVPLVRDIGLGRPIELAVSVGQSFAGLTSLQVQVQTSPDNTTWTTVDSGAVIPAASLVAGYLFSVPKRIEKANARYLQLYYTVVGTATQGTINAEIVASRQMHSSAGSA
jgi:hypothetical protein